MEIKPQNIVDLTKRILLRLGGGTVRIELTKEQFEYALSKALRWFSIRKGIKKWGKIITKADVTEYPVDSDVEEILEVIPQARRFIYPANAAFNSDDIFSYIMNPSSLGKYSMDMAFIGMANLESQKRFLAADFAWEFMKEKKVLKISPVPSGGEIIVYCYVVPITDENFSALSLRDIDMIENYAIAQCKLLLGTIRRKYGSYVGGGGDISIDSQTLIDEAKEEIEKLELEIYDNQEPGGILFG